MPPAYKTLLQTIACCITGECQKLPAMMQVDSICKTQAVPYLSIQGRPVWHSRHHRYIITIILSHVTLGYCTLPKRTQSPRLPHSILCTKKDMSKTGESGLASSRACPSCWQQCRVDVCCMYAQAPCLPNGNYVMDSLCDIPVLWMQFHVRHNLQSL